PIVGRARSTRGARRGVRQSCRLPLVVALLLAGTLAAAQQPGRVALLIANTRYDPSVGRIDGSPAVDRIGAALANDGFRVTALKDAGLKDMAAALTRHASELRRAGPGSIGFFYYGGLAAVQPQTQHNFLIPVDVASADGDTLWVESLPQSVVL